MSQVTLKKSITFIEAIAIVIGSIIGSGIFLKPSIVFGNAGSPVIGLLAWVAGGIITLSTAVLIFVIIMNIIATKFGGVFQTVATAGKLVPIVTIILFGLISGGAHDFRSIQIVTGVPASALRSSVRFGLTTAGSA